MDSPSVQDQSCGQSEGWSCQLMHAVTDRDATRCSCIPVAQAERVVAVVGSSQAPAVVSCTHCRLDIACTIPAGHASVYMHGPQLGAGSISASCRDMTVPVNHQAYLAAQHLSWGCIWASCGKPKSPASGRSPMPGSRRTWQAACLRGSVDLLRLDQVWQVEGDLQAASQQQTCPPKLECKNYMDRDVQLPGLLRPHAMQPKQAQPYHVSSLAASSTGQYGAKALQMAKSRCQRGMHQQAGQAAISAGCAEGGHRDVPALPQKCSPPQQHRWQVVLPADEELGKSQSL